MKIYNTLTRTKEDFKPIKKGRVGMYVCGPTVYDEPHIGHARSAYIFEYVRRYLRYRDFKVTLVKNITDVDDKIITKARAEIVDRQGQEAVKDLNQATKQVAEKYLKRYHEDMDALGIGRPDSEPRATEYIKNMIQVVERLLQRGYAYEAGGDVYFEVRKYNQYGKLSHQSLDNMEAGARIEPGEHKKDPLDFALWKKSKEDEPFWPSPWGNGRPGWHIECSVMSTRLLAENFDIHGGGLDLIFPHHENEIAQAQAFTNSNFANYWMHNGLLTIDGEKMSKSLGNFVSVKDCLERYAPDRIKFFFLTSHYRSPIDFSDEKMEDIKRSYGRFTILFDKLDKMKVRATAKRELRPIADIFNTFIEAMDDDFNTPKAIGEMFELVNVANQTMQDEKLSEKTKRETLGGIRFYLEDFGAIFGLFKDTWEVGEALSAFIEQKIRERNVARKARDFQKADRIRTELLDRGIILEDAKDDTHWRTT
jgi:cysteinyl-tRNA synthetase